MTSQLLQRYTALPRAQKFLCALCSLTCLGFSYHSTKFGGEHKKTVLSTKKMCSAQNNCARYRKTWNFTVPGLRENLEEALQEIDELAREQELGELLGVSKIILRDWRVKRKKLSGH